MSEKKRKNFSSQFKAKVALEAIRGVKTVTEIAQELACIQRKWGSGKKCCKNRPRAYLILYAAPRR